MKRFRLNSIRGRIICIVLLGTCISIAFFLSYTYDNITRRINQTVESSYLMGLRTVGSRLEQAFTEMHCTAAGLTYQNGLFTQVEEYVLSQDVFLRRTLSSRIQGQLALDDFSSQIVGRIAFCYAGDPDQVIFSSDDLVRFHAGEDYFFSKEPGSRFYPPRAPAMAKGVVLALRRYAGSIDGRDVFVYIESDRDFLPNLFSQMKDRTGSQLPVCLLDQNGTVVYTNGGLPVETGEVFDQDAIQKSYVPFFYQSEQWTLSLCVPKADYLGISWSVFREFSAMLIIYVVLYILLAVFICQAAYRPLDAFVKELSGARHASSLFSRRAAHSQEFDEYTQKIEQLRGEIHRLMTQVEQESKQNAYLENQLLLSRINPHFIHNTLNSIQLQAAGEGRDGLSGTIQALNSLLYHNLGKNKVTTLRDELRAADDYVYLQHRILPFAYEKEVSLPDELLDLQMPAFVLQPMIENCFQHASSPGLVIRLRVFAEEDRLHLILEDNGQGISPEKEAQLNRQFLAISAGEAGIGLSYVNSALKMFFSGRVAMTIGNRSDGPGARVSIEIQLEPRLL